MTEHERQKLTEAVKRLREVAEPVGSQHAFWEIIFDAEAALLGRPTLLPVDEILRIATQEQT